MTSSGMLLILMLTVLLYPIRLISDAVLCYRIRKQGFAYNQLYNAAFSY